MASYLEIIAGKRQRTATGSTTPRKRRAKRASKEVLKKALEKALEKGKPRLVFDGGECEWAKGWAPQCLQIVETRPLFRTVKISGIRVERKQELLPISLAFPYMQYYWMANRFRVTWSLKPLKKPGQNIGVPLLPNVSKNATICMGDFPCKNATDICHGFWNTIFTPEEGGWYYKKTLENTALQSFIHWSKLSRKVSDPMEVFKGFKIPHKFSYHKLRETS
jgi:hypothetical protein